MAYPKNIYGFIALTGGAQGALDAIDGAALDDQDMAIGVVAGVVHQYWLDIDSGAAENSPYVIAPDTNAGDKRWILTSINKLTGDLDANNHSINNLSGIDGILPIGGDGTAGRILRMAYLQILDGTNASTIKCTVVNRWNGDAIAETDNISKNATTGHFTLSEDGKELRIEASGLTGNVVMAFGAWWSYTIGTAVYNLDVAADSNDILLKIRDTGGAVQDFTALTDSGNMFINILYITDA